MSDSNLEELARDAHEAWPNDLSFPEVFSLLNGWKRHGPSMPRTDREKAWLAGLKKANQTLYLEVTAGIPIEGSNPQPHWKP